MNFIIHLLKSLILFIRRRRNWKRAKPKVVVQVNSEGAISGIQILQNAIGGMARSAAYVADSLRALGKTEFMSEVNKSREEYAKNLLRMMKSRFAWRHKPAFEPGGYIHEEPQDYDFQEKIYPKWEATKRELRQRIDLQKECTAIYARMITAENLDLHCLKISLIAEEAKLYLHSAINPEAIADRAVRKARAEELARKGWIVTPEEVVPEFDKRRRAAAPPLLTH